jgi:hypothetical protein
VRSQRLHLAPRQSGEEGTTCQKRIRSLLAQDGYEASYGSYRIDDSSTFTFHIEGALVRTLIGGDLKRQYEFSGNHLTVKSTDPNEHWKVVWERY